MIDHVIILAGGSGSRLWPASTRTRPKQFLNPGTGKSLLQMTIQRAAAVAQRGSIIIVTHVSQLSAVVQECLPLTSLRERIVILPEPQMRSTAPALALATTWLCDAGATEDTSLVLASDHLIDPVETFTADVDRGVELARQGKLVVFGITPTRAETGYGYIEQGKPLHPGYGVRSFREKPDSATAEKYFHESSFFWNSGMFLFRNDVFLEELRRWEPAVTEPFTAIDSLSFEDRRADLPVETREGITVAWQSTFMEQLYTDLPTTSIDYAVMERSDQVAMVPASFLWNDVGSWDEMAQLVDDGVVPPPRAVVWRVESPDNYVYADMPVVLCGVEDLVVVVQNGKVLVSRRGKGQLVRDAVQAIRNGGREDLT